jgi:hypothetical protein
MNDGQLKSAWQRLPEDAAAPFGYDEFLARVQARQERCRFQRRVGTGAGGTLALLLVVAVGWRAQQPTTALDVAPPFEAPATLSVAPARNDAPALVDADTYIAVMALEDRLAWFDDALSEARVSARRVAADTTRVRELEHERDQLAQSLRQVKYAAELSAAM